MVQKQSLIEVQQFMKQAKIDTIAINQVIPLAFWKLLQIFTMI